MTKQGGGAMVSPLSNETTTAHNTNAIMMSDENFQKYTEDQSSVEKVKNAIPNLDITIHEDPSYEGFDQTFLKNQRVFSADDL